VLPRDVIFELLPILLHHESLLAHGLIPHVIENLIEPLVVLLWKICSHLLLMYQCTAATLLVRTRIVAC
jgi:hypothetical protein